MTTPLSLNPKQVVRLTRASVAQAPGEACGILLGRVVDGERRVLRLTVSANLAIALAAQGASVGLMDADIYGPSIPTIMGINRSPEIEGGRIQPVTAHGGCRRYIEDAQR